MNAEPTKSDDGNGTQSSSRLVIEPVAFERARADTRRRRLAFKPVPIAISLVLAAAVSVLVFTVTARAVRLVVTPAPDGIRIESGWPTYRLADRYLMLPGAYDLTVTKEGYEILATAIEVGSDADQAFEFTLTKLPGILDVTSVPAVEGTVYIDDEEAGPLPLTIQSIPAGLHTVAVETARYQPFTAQIDIEGRRVEQVLTAELVPAWGTVEVITTPPGAAIRLDDAEVGATPDVLEIMQGRHDLSLKLRGYKRWQSTLDVVAEEAITLPPITLVKADGTLSLTSAPTGATVTIDGAFRGQTPLALKLPPGQGYDIALSKSGYKDASRRIEIEPEEDIDMQIRLDPVLAVIQLAVTPADATLFLNGERLGDPNRRLELSAARHELRITKDGFAPYSSAITPRPGYDQLLRIDLETIEQAKAAATPQIIVTADGQRLKLVIPSKLVMGAPRREPGRRSNEPEREVVLERPFYAGIHEVTNDAFLQFDSTHDSGRFGRAMLNQEERPVVNVTWNQAAAYANWLSERDGLPAAYILAGERYVGIEPMNTGYRLITEAEWAWIARYAGGRPTRFPWGDSMPPTSKAGNFADAVAEGLVEFHIKEYRDGFLGSAPSGSYAANGLGFYDLNGNVAEWVHDIYMPNPVLAGVGSQDPTGPAEGEFHVIRGASYMHGRFSELRWTYRDYGAKARPDVGFRLARYLE